MNPLLDGAFTSLDRAGVDWCLLRGRHDLEAPSGDVDLLVAKRDAPRADRALVEAGFKQQRTWAGGSQRFFLGQDPSGGWVLLHVTTRIAFGSWYQLETYTATSVLARRRYEGGVSVAAPADELWISLLHCLLDKGRIADKHRQRLPQLAPSALPDDEVVRSVAARCPRSWRTEVVLDEIKRGAWMSLESASAPLLREWRRSDPLRSRVRAAVNFTSLWSRKLSEPLLRPGQSVALLAPDGAGKSTVAASLSGALPVPVRTLYLGLYGACMPRPPIAVPGAGFLTRLTTVRWRWLVGRWHRMRRQVVVFDRHPIEARLAKPGSTALARFRQRMLARAAPLPDLVVVLDAPGTVLAARKPEHDAASLEASRMAYLALAATLPNAVVVDATQPAAEVRRTIVKLIWDRERGR